MVFTHDSEVMYAVNLDQEVDDDTKFETAFKTFDARDYSLIATIETKKSVLGLCPSWDDCNLAVIEQVILTLSHLTLASLCFLIFSLTETTWNLL